MIIYSYHLWISNTSMIVDGWYDLTEDVCLSHELWDNTIFDDDDDDDGLCM